MPFRDYSSTIDVIVQSWFNESLLSIRAGNCFRTQARTKERGLLRLNILLLFKIFKLKTMRFANLLIHMEHDFSTVVAMPTLSFSVMFVTPLQGRSYT
jgi:hypothetical protein